MRVASFRSRLSWLDRWWLPFLWIMLTPLITVPVSRALVEAGLREGTEVGLPTENMFGTQFKYGSVLATLVWFTLPGTLNLAPWAWAFSSTARVSAAGCVAGLLGLFRLALPTLVLMSETDRLTGTGGSSYFAFARGGVFDADAPYDDAWVLGGFAWLGSLLYWGIFAVVIRGKGRSLLGSVFFAVAAILLLFLAALGAAGLGLLWPLWLLGLAAPALAGFVLRRRFMVGSTNVS